MATRMSWQHSQLPKTGMLGDFNGDNQFQDMHLKMSKKIAQLTKVIYALNTKNDEHEASMLALQDSHEEEMQQMLSETSVKIQQYRLKIGNELDLRRKIQNLEECVQALEKERKVALNEMESYKAMVGELEVNEKRNHEMQILSINRELLETKGAFEQRINDFEATLSSLEREKLKTVDSLNLDYHSVIEKLKSDLEQSKQNHVDEKTSILNSHSKTVLGFSSEIENLKQEMRKNMEDAESKMDKAKAFYERELLAVKAGSLTDDELAAKWQERENQIRQETGRLEVSLRNKVQELKDEMAVQTEEISCLKKDLQQAESQANSTVDHVKDLRDQLSKLQQDYNSSTEKTKFLEEELSTSRARLEQQSNDIIRKSSIIGTLEAIKLTQDESIVGLETQLKELKKRYYDLESERHSIKANQAEETTVLFEQLKAMEKKLSTAVNERMESQKQFKLELEETRMNHEEEFENLRQQFEKEAASMDKNHQSEITLMKNEANEELEKQRNAQKESHEVETRKLVDEKNTAMLLLSDQIKEHKNNLRLSQNEVNRLVQVIEQHEGGLGDAGMRIDGLQSRIRELETELKNSNTWKTEMKSTLHQLKSELKQQTYDHEDKVRGLLRDHQSELDKAKLEVEGRWEDITRTKLEEQQARLSSLFEDEKRKAISELEMSKEREMEAEKSGWESQIKQLSLQMTEMRRMFDRDSEDLKRHNEELRNEMAENERKLRGDSIHAASEYSEKIERLVESHSLSTENMKQKHDDDLRNKELLLNSRHREEMHSNMRTQQIAVESLKQVLQREKAEELQRREEEYQQDLDELKSELLNQYSSNMDDVKRNCESQLYTANNQLDQLKESSLQNEEKLNNRLNELESELRFSAADLNKKQDKITLQNEQLESVNLELDAKGKEILKVRSEVNTEMRRREDDLRRKYQSEQDRYEADSIRQKQMIVNEFNRATDALKDKVTSLHISLKEAEENYLRRDSRPEDLDMIQQLKRMVHDKEEQVDRLMDEKKYYHMELVNRETNFNKVFNAAPNIGVMNPLQKKRKTNTVPSRFASQFVSVPNLSTIESAMAASNRLDPLISNSNNKPMQPTPPSHPKKFMR